jgi:hypothetical protein
LQTSATPEERGDDSDESDTDSGEDCDKHENVFTGIDLDASTNQLLDPLSSTIESESVSSHCSTSTAEEESDGGEGNKLGSSKQMNSYVYRLAEVYI